MNRKCIVAALFVMRIMASWASCSFAEGEEYEYTFSEDTNVRGEAKIFHSKESKSNENREEVVEKRQLLQIETIYPTRFPPLTMYDSCCSIWKSSELASLEGRVGKNFIDALIVENYIPLSLTERINRSPELAKRWNEEKENIHFLHSLSALRNAIWIQSAEINFKIKGLSSLHMAVLLENILLVQQLLQEGHNPKVQDANGKTPLDYAMALGKIELIRGGRIYPSWIMQLQETELQEQILMREIKENAINFMQKKIKFRVEGLLENRDFLIKDWDSIQSNELSYLIELLKSKVKIKFES